MLTHGDGWYLNLKCVIISANEMSQPNNLNIGLHVHLEISTWQPNHIEKIYLIITLKPQEQLIMELVDILTWNV